jgi:hypothetical protein
MNVIAEMTISSLRELGVPHLPNYEAALAAACEAAPPPFGRASYGTTYRRIAVNPHWLAESLIVSAEREGDGASRLWSLAACTRDETIRSAVKRHAIDESRHSRWYIKLLDLCFPGSVDDELRPLLDALSPGYSRGTEPRAVPGSPFAHEVTIDDLIQMNIAEVRTMIHHLLQRPVLLAHTPAESRANVTKLLAPLLLDEKLHVAYSAKLIESLTVEVGVDGMRELMAKRVRDFNAITDSELASGIFESS